MKTPSPRQRGEIVPMLVIRNRHYALLLGRAALASRTGRSKKTIDRSKHLTDCSRHPRIIYGRPLGVQGLYGLLIAHYENLSRGQCRRSKA